jgi:hypothetical protein
MENINIDHDMLIYKSHKKQCGKIDFRHGKAYFPFGLRLFESGKFIPFDKQVIQQAFAE